MDHENTHSHAHVSLLFHDTTAHVEPDVDILVRGSIERGRVKRRRHNILTGCAAAVAMVGVAGVTTSLVPSSGSASDVGLVGGSIVTTAPATNPTATSNPHPSGKSVRPPAIPKADIPVEAANLPQLFQGIYPGTISPAEKSTGRIIDDGKAGQYAHFRWNGFTTSVAFVAYAGTPAQRCSQFQADSGRPLACQTRPDGTSLVSMEQTAPDADGGGSSVGVWLFTKHGYEISIVSYNTRTLSGNPLAARPPFGITQLTHAVTSKAWF